LESSIKYLEVQKKTLEGNIDMRRGYKQAEKKFVRMTKTFRKHDMESENPR
jgi:hypothetical protein